MRRLTVEQFRGEIRGGVIRPGDCVLYRYRRQTPVSWLIRRCQERMLADLDNHEAVSDRPAPWRTLDAAGYTHAGAVCDRRRSVEMTSPRARTITWWARLAVGDQVLVRRPLREDGTDIYLSTGKQIAAEGLEDKAKGVRYPLRELVTYYAWSWGWRKLHRGERFLDVFRSSNSDVCSGRYWTWCRRAGVYREIDNTDACPEAWYPARLAVSGLFRTVAEVQIVAVPEPVRPLPEIPAWRDIVRPFMRDEAIQVAAV